MHRERRFHPINELLYTSSFALRLSLKLAFEFFLPEVPSHIPIPDLIKGIGYIGKKTRRPHYDLERSFLEMMDMATQIILVARIEYEGFHNLFV